ncbi:unnamed protein product [Pseudo-nitzschia multistriata]|uniref:DUF6824 domain-containing protein n=1 Tax=Pseudo-nitzschia multistriata TaxID=183589 RepID=A0A448YUC4_9STRA|nr:unnamed protein product [Pseudo-nitzschia multistriata]
MSMYSDSIVNIVNEEPDVADKMLSKELLRMSLKERNAIEEEVHGVGTTAIEETPDRVQESLRLLAFELDEKIPPHRKIAYTKSQTIPDTYVNTKSFRLRFLRSTHFDSTRAAQKIAKFLDVATHLFGNDLLKRPVRITDFSCNDLRDLQKGRLQLLPFLDRSGRRIFVFFPDEVWEAFEAETKARISLYLSWTAGNDVEIQRQGLVFVVWIAEEFKITDGGSVLVRDKDYHTVRASALHICCPDTPFHRFRRAVIAMRVGTSVELLYRLQSYGIQSEQIPITCTGVVKTSNNDKWVRVRRAIEASEYDQVKDSAIGVIYEFPKFNDVVFRTGTSSRSHAANARFRTMVQSKLEENARGYKNDESVLKRKDIIKLIIDEIKAQGGRFLVWNDIGGWNQLVDEKIIFAKITHLMKEIQRAAPKPDRTTKMTPSLQSDTATFSNAKHEHRSCTSPICGTGAKDSRLF